MDPHTDVEYDPTRKPKRRIPIPNSQNQKWKEKKKRKKQKYHWGCALRHLRTLEPSSFISGSFGFLPLYFFATYQRRPIAHRFVSVDLRLLHSISPSFELDWIGWSKSCNFVEKSAFWGLLTGIWFIFVSILCFPIDSDRFGHVYAIRILRVAYTIGFFGNHGVCLCLRWEIGGFDQIHILFDNCNFNFFVHSRCWVIIFVNLYQRCCEDMIEM